MEGLLFVISFVVMNNNVAVGCSNGKNACDRGKVAQCGVSEQVYFLDVVQRNYMAHGRICLACESISEFECDIWVFPVLSTWKTM